MSRKKSREFVHRLRQLQSEGQGVFRIEAFHSSDVPALFLASEAGDIGAIRTAGLIGQFLRMITTARPPALCLLCDNELSPAALPPTILIMTAQRDDPSTAIVNGLCVTCAGKPELEAAVLDTYRDTLIPDLRRLPPFEAPGRA
jgi:hypothetical protein